MEDIYEKNPGEHYTGDSKASYMYLASSVNLLRTLIGYQIDILVYLTV